MANSFQDHGIQIPLKNNTIVHVFRVDMEQNVDGVLKLLKVEVPALAVWANFAIQYFQLGNNDAALNVLKEADQVAKTQQINDKCEFSDFCFAGWVCGAAVRCGAALQRSLHWF